MNKKGQLGLDIAKAFILGMLILFIVGFVTVIVTNELNTSANPNVVNTATNITNETRQLSNATLGGNTTSIGTSLEALVLTNVFVTNRTSGVTVQATNYTVSGGTITGVQPSQYVGQLVNISAGYTWVTASSTRLIFRNVTGGIQTFFSNSGTWFSLLAVVVIILIVSMVILVVNRFSEGKREGIRGSGLGSGNL